MAAADFLGKTALHEKAKKDGGASAGHHRPHPGPGHAGPQGCHQHVDLIS